MTHRTSKFRTFLVATATATATVLAVAACGGDTSGGSSTGGASGAGGDAKVAAVIKGLDNPFFQAMQKGIQDTAGDDGATVSIQAAADIGDTTGQADKLSALAGQGYGCYVVNPISGSNLIQ